MTDWTNPTPDTPFLDVLDILKARDVDSATMGTPTNPPIGCKRWSETDQQFQTWNGSHWLPMPVNSAWVDWGHSPARVSGTALSVLGNHTSLYQTGRRARVHGDGNTVIFGTITACAYDSDNGWTLVTLALDSGTLTAPLTAVALSVLDTPDALPVVPITHGGTGATDIPSALAALGVPFAGVVSQSTSGAETIADRGRLIVCSGSITRTIPPAASGAGVVLAWHNSGNGVLTIARSGADLVATQTALVLYPGETAVLVSDGISKWHPLVPLTARLAMPVADRASSVVLDPIADAGRLQRCVGPVSLTLPACTAVPHGWTLPVINAGGGVITIAATASDLIAGAATRTLDLPGDSMTVVNSGTQWEIIGAVSLAGTPMDGFAAQLIGLFL